MHIAFLTPEYPHPNLSRSGGLGTSIKNLAKGLVEQKAKVTVFVVGQTEDLDVFDEGTRVISIAKKKHLAFNWYLERKRYQQIIQTYIEAEHIQLIEAPDWTGLSAFMKFSVPLIIRLNGSDAYFCHLDGRKQKKKNFFLERKALKDADTIVSVSDFTGQLTKKLFKLKKSITTIHNGINVEDFKPLNLEINHHQILYFGTIIRKKGVLELAQSFNFVVEQIPNASLVLIGKDAVDVFEKQSTWTLFYNLLSEKAQAKVQHLEEVSYKDIKRYIAKAQVVVLPSFAEAFPMTWLETLAMEKPLVSSNVGWANELMINGVTGYTVNPKNHAMYAKKIVELVNDVPKCTKFGKAGRLHVIEKFSTPIITKQNMAFYKKCMNQ
ncbi:MAG: glycosyltransferase family 4 protein [Gelidibacter sp.]